MPAVLLEVRGSLWPFSRKCLHTPASGSPESVSGPPHPTSRTVVLGEQRLTELRTWHPLLLGLQLPGHNRAPGIREQAQDLPYLALPLAFPHLGGLAIWAHREPPPSSQLMHNIPLQRSTAHLTQSPVVSGPVIWTSPLWLLTLLPLINFYMLFHTSADKAVKLCSQT